MTFDEYWQQKTWTESTPYAKAIAERAWDAAIESIRTTERMPVSERLLAAVLRIETKLNHTQGTKEPEDHPRKGFFFKIPNK